MGQAIENQARQEVATAIQEIFAAGRQPKSLRTDKGSEFTNRILKQYLKDNNIHHILTYNETKANCAERTIKTIKLKLFRYILHNQTYEYLDVLQKTAHSYNATKHRSLGRPPAEITKDNEQENRYQQYLIRSKPKTANIKARAPRYHVGDVVRISHGRRVFDREYQQKWTGELFKIITVYR